MKKSLTGLVALILMIVLCSGVVAACGESKSAEQVLIDTAIEKINRIPDPLPETYDGFTLSVQQIIGEAKDAVARLTTDAMRSQVTNMSKLDTAVATYERLKSANRAQMVIDAINNIPEIAALVFKDIAGKIDPARTAYRGLSDPEKLLVTNYSKLVDAEEMKLHINAVHLFDAQLALKTATDVTEAELAAFEATYSEIVNNTTRNMILTNHYSKALTKLNELRDAVLSKKVAAFNANNNALTNLLSAIDSVVNYMAGDFTYCNQSSLNIANNFYSTAYNLLAAFTEASAIPKAKNETDFEYDVKVSSYTVKITELTVKKVSLSLSYSKITDAQNVLDAYKAIEALGTVENSTAFKLKMQAAETAVVKLNIELQGVLVNFATYNTKRLSLSLLEEYNRAAQAIDQKINAIGTVNSLNQKASIVAARDLYNAPELNGVVYTGTDINGADIIKTIQGMVTKLTTLTAAETTLAKLEENSRVTEIATTFGAKVLSSCIIAEITASNYDLCRALYEDLIAERNALETAARDKIQQDAATRLTSYNARLTEVKKMVDFCSAVVLVQLETVAITTTLEVKISTAKTNYNSITSSADRLAVAAEKTILDQIETKFNALKSINTSIETFVARMTTLGELSAFTNSSNDKQNLTNAKAAYDELLAKVSSLRTQIAEISAEAETRVNQLAALLSDFTLKQLSLGSASDAKTAVEAAIRNIPASISIGTFASYKTAVLNARATYDVYMAMPLATELGTTMKSNLTTAETNVANMQPQMDAIIALVAQMADTAALPESVNIVVPQGTTELTNYTDIIKVNFAFIEKQYLGNATVKDTAIVMTEAMRNALNITYAAQYNRYVSIKTRITYIDVILKFTQSVGAFPTADSITTATFTDTNTFKLSVETQISYYRNTLTSAQRQEAIVIAAYSKAIEVQIKTEAIIKELSDIKIVQSFFTRVDTVTDGSTPLPSNAAGLTIAHKTKLTSFTLEFYNDILKIYNKYNWYGSSLSLELSLSTRIISFQSLLVVLNAQMVVLEKEAADKVIVNALATDIKAVNISHINYKSENNLSSVNGVVKALEDRYSLLSAEILTNWQTYVSATLKEVTVNGSTMEIISYLAYLRTEITVAQLKQVQFLTAQKWVNDAKGILPNYKNKVNFAVTDYTADIINKITELRMRLDAGITWNIYVNVSEFSEDFVNYLIVAEYMVEAKACYDEIALIVSSTNTVVRSEIVTLLTKAEFALGFNGKYQNLANEEIRKKVTNRELLIQSIVTLQAKKLMYEQIDYVDSLIPSLRLIPATLTNNHKLEIVSAYTEYIKLTESQKSELLTGTATLIQGLYSKFVAYENSLLNYFKEEVQKLPTVGTIRIEDEASLTILFNYYNYTLDPEQQTRVSAAYNELVLRQTQIITLKSNSLSAVRAAIAACPDAINYTYTTHEKTVEDMIVLFELFINKTSLTQAETDKVDALKLAVKYGKVQRVADKYLNLLGIATIMTVDHINNLLVANYAYNDLVANTELAPLMNDTQFDLAWQKRDEYNIRKVLLEKLGELTYLLSTIPSTVNIEKHEAKIIEARAKYDALTATEALEPQAITALAKIEDFEDQIVVLQDAAYVVGDLLLAIDVSTAYCTTIYQEEIAALKVAYNNLSSGQKALIVAGYTNLVSVETEIKKQLAEIEKVYTAMRRIPASGVVTLTNEVINNINATEVLLNAINSYGTILQADSMMDIIIDSNLYAIYSASKTVVDNKLWIANNFNNTQLIRLNGMTIEYSWVVTYFEVYNSYLALSTDVQRFAGNVTAMLSNYGQMKTIKDGMELFVTLLRSMSLPISTTNYADFLNLRTQHDTGISLKVKNGFDDVNNDDLDNDRATFILFMSELTLYENTLVNWVVTKLNYLYSLYSTQSLTIYYESEYIELDTKYNSLYTTLKLDVITLCQIDTKLPQIAAKITELKGKSAVYAGIASLYGNISNLRYYNYTTLMSLKHRFETEFDATEMASPEYAAAQVQLNALVARMTILSEVNDFCVRVETLYNRTALMLSDETELDALNLILTTYDQTRRDIVTVFITMLISVNGRFDLIRPAQAVVNQIALLAPALSAPVQGAQFAVDVAAAEAAFNALSIEAKAAVNNKYILDNASLMVLNQSVINSIIQHIDNLYNIKNTLTITDRDEIYQLYYGDYEGLNAVLKPRITNLNKLQELVAMIGNMALAKDFEDQLAALALDKANGQLTLSKAGDVQDLRHFYTNLTLAQKSYLASTSLNKLIELENFMASLSIARTVNSRIDVLNEKRAANSLLLSDKTEYNAINNKINELLASDLDAYNAINRNLMSDLSAAFATIRANVIATAQNLLNTFNNLYTSGTLSWTHEQNLLSLDNAIAACAADPTIYSELLYYSNISLYRSTVANSKEAKIFGDKVKAFVASYSEVQGSYDLKALAITNLPEVNSLRTEYSSLTNASLMDSSLSVYVVQLFARADQLAKIKQFIDAVNSLTSVCPGGTSAMPIPGTPNFSQVVALVSSCRTAYNNLDGTLKNEVQTSTSYRTYYSTYRSFDDYLVGQYGSY